MLMVSSWAMAQHTITGKVTDGTTGEEIIGASVTEVDATGRVISAAVTNINGEYFLRLSPISMVSIPWSSRTQRTKSQFHTLAIRTRR